MRQLLTTLINAIKAKITPIWTKIKLYTSKTYLQTVFLSKIRSFFSRHFDLKPKDKKDYYSIGHWLVSKRFAFAAVIVIGVLSLFYIFVINPPAIFSSGEDAIPTYAYNSIPLRFTEGKVRIKAKSGYIAYEGSVDGGKATGFGTLFDKEGDTVYAGEFEKSKFNGLGKMYYPGDLLKYDGEFKENAFEGEGTLYRENGSVEYKGMFSKNLKNGEGKLYDESSSQVYTGNFSQDHLVYSDLLGKSSEEIAECYTGRNKVYMGGSTFAVSMKDIDAVYVGDSDQNNLDETVMVNQIYVLKDTFPIGKKDVDTISDLKAYFKETQYEGNSNVTLSEAVCINELSEKKDVFSGKVEMYTEEPFDDAVQIIGYDINYVLYLYSFEKDGLIYTFYCQDKNQGFSMYSIAKVE